jgi:thiol-disulfide isomerase/thioredoxin
MRPLLLIFLTLLWSITNGQKISKVALKTMPAAQLVDIDGNITNLLDLTKGKVTLIDFWFIPCGPCFQEMRMLHKIYNEYRSNASFSFLTITFSDSAFVKNLIENHNTDINEVYDYFKTLAKLDTFRLPVYFLKDYTTKMKRFKRNNNGEGFSGSNLPSPKNEELSPASIFGFSAYPTILVFDKMGKLVYNRTGFNTKIELQELKEIEKIINSNL